MRPHDLPEQPQCGLRILDSGESPEYPSFAGVAAAILPCIFLRGQEFAATRRSAASWHYFLICWLVFSAAFFSC